MNDRENDKMRETEGRQIQQELENQMRAFGDTVSDAFAHGFEGRGMEIGDRAWGVGKAAVHAAKHIFGLKNEQTPVELLRADGKKRSDAGVALLVVGILLVMGAYRIFSYLCENAALDARTFLLGAACLLLAVVGFLLARRSFRRLQYLRDNEE